MSRQPMMSDAPPVWQSASPGFERKSEYVLADLLRFDDADFIEVAYQALLLRNVDPAENEGYLTALRTGAIGKVEILGLIRFSAEGRKCGVHVDGLLLPYKLHRWRRRRVIGPALAFVMAVARLPRLVFRLQSIEAKAAQQNQQLGTALNRLVTDVHERLAGIESTVPEAVAQGFVAFERSFDRGLEAGQAFATEPQYLGASAGESRCRPGVDPVAFKNAMLGAVTAESAVPPSLGSNGGVAMSAQRAALMVNRAIDSRTRDLGLQMIAVTEDGHGRLEQVRAELLNRLGGLAERAALTRLAEAVEEVRGHVRGYGDLGAGLRALEAQTAELAGIVGSHVSETDNHVKAIKEVLWTKADQAPLAALSAGLEELKLSLKVHCEATDLASRAYEQSLLASRRELPHMHERVGQPAMHAPEDGFDARALDSFYVKLEDQFRGSSELISKRCEAYVPVVQAAIERTQGGVILDIGCGRGEWLRLLGERGFEARGIDLNEAMILECRAAGLDVQEAEAIAYLRGLPDASIAAITGMHIIEHIPFPSLVMLFDEAVRVLKPGGVAVFETPNPENIDVGACSFYMDPTHLHPLPPPLVEFTARARGFDQVEIRRLSEHRQVPVPPEIKKSGQPESTAIQWLLDRSRERLSVSPDYAAIAWKGGAL